MKNEKQRQQKFSFQRKKQTKTSYFAGICSMTEGDVIIFH